MKGDLSPFKRAIARDISAFPTAPITIPIIHENRCGVNSLPIIVAYEKHNTLYVASVHLLR